MAPKGVVAAASKDLPGNPEDLLETVEITARHPLSERDTSYAFDYLYSTAYTATIKLNDFRYTAFTVSNALIERKPEHLSSTDRVKSFAAKSVPHTPACLVAHIACSQQVRLSKCPTRDHAQCCASV